MTTAGSTPKFTSKYYIMANWCYTSYTFVGDKNDLRSLYEFMQALGDDHGFDTLLKALGADPEEVRCRGEWNDLALNSDSVTFTTYTAGNPLYQAIYLLCHHFRALTYYYYAEEPMGGIYVTNDVKGFYYPKRFTDDGEPIELANFHTSLTPYPNEDGTTRLVTPDGTKVGTVSFGVKEE